MFTQIELQSNAVVCSEKGMRDAPLRIVKNLERMTRINARWTGKAVSCIYFPDPKNAWENEPASRVAGRRILGNAVLLGVTAAEVAASQTAKTWANLASKLPKTVPLDEYIVEMHAQEQAEREADWRDHMRRKQARRQKVNLSSATVDLISGKLIGENDEEYEDDAIREAFAEWAEPETVDE